MKWPHQWIKDYLKARMREFVLSFRDEITAPHYNWGYRDASGAFREKARISSTTIITHPDRAFIADNVYVGHYAILDSVGGLTIDEGVQIGSWVGIYTHSSHLSLRLLGRHYTEVPEEKKAGHVVKPVRVGRYTSVGTSSLIAPGVTIGKGVMIYPLSYIQSDIPDFSLVRDGKVIGDTRIYDRRFTRKDETLRRWVEEWQNDDPPGSDRGAP